MDEIFVYYSSWLNPRSIVQSIYRPRHIKNNRIIIYSEPNRISPIKKELYPHINCEVYRNLIDNVIIEKSCYGLDSLYYLAKRNGIGMISTGLSIEEYNELEELVKFEEQDDYRITYDKIKNINEERLIELYNKFEGGKISLSEKYELEKYRFKLDNNYSNPTEESVKDMWLFRNYIPILNELSTNDNHVINRFLKENNVNLWHKRFAEFRVDGCVPKGFDIKSLIFLDSFKYRKTIDNYGQDIYAKIINAYFGNIL